MPASSLAPHCFLSRCTVRGSVGEGSIQVSHGALCGQGNGSLGTIWARFSSHVDSRTPADPSKGERPFPMGKKPLNHFQVFAWTLKLTMPYSLSEDDPEDGPWVGPKLDHIFFP